MSESGFEGIHLRLMATSDLHGVIRPFDYVTDRPAPGLGLACAATLIDRLRRAAPNALLFDNGDFLQGTPLSDEAAENPGRRRGPHPVIAAMNRMGYAAATLGNHDFNFGLPALRLALAKADFPLVSANALLAEGGRPLLDPWRILDLRLRDAAGATHPLRLGVIGFLPPQTALWDNHILAGQVETPDILATARTQVPALRAAGADLVVALAHSGIGRAEAAAGAENAATALAALPGIDAVFAGHSHLTFPGPDVPPGPGIDPVAGLLSGRPAAMPGAMGSHVAVIDLHLARPDDAWTVAGSRAAVVVVPRRSRPSRPITVVTRGAHARTRARMAAVVGRTDRPLTTHFALVAPSGALDLVATALAASVRDRLAGRPEAALPVVAAVAPFHAGGYPGPANYTTIPAGPILRRHVEDLYPFPNHLRALRLTGADIADWLERSAALFLRTAPGPGDLPLIDPAFPSYNFDVFPALTYRMGPGRPAREDAGGGCTARAGGGVSDVRLEGRPLARDAQVVVATNSYRMATRRALAGCEVPLGAPVTCRDALATHLSAVRQSDIGTGWRLDLPAGCAVLFATAPDADPAQLGAAGLSAEPCGHDSRGFAVLRLTRSA
ncbi:MAG TPA: 5'-nucleotidase C-terminal domain-containing protein [Paracoccaceae bacterium]|nr:5'-nucleotidase C-terminal domain-containing protein [Paracoccaceae bacterium]